MSEPKFTAEDFASIFDEFFAEKRPQQNGDFDLSLSLTIQEAMQGVVQKTVTYQRLILCPTCEATGAAPGATTTICSKCQGTGELRTTQQTFLGSVVRVNSCNKCNGLGRKISKPCPVCLGKTRVAHEATITVDIPAGVKLGTRIQFDGMGSISPNNTQYGNLFLKIVFAADNRLVPDGDDIILRWQINAHDYQAGKKIRVPTLDGYVLVTLPKLELIEGKLMRLRGKGLPDGQERGDQFIHLEILSWQRSLQTVQQNLSNWIERFTQGKSKNKSKTMPIIDVEFTHSDHSL